MENLNLGKCCACEVKNETVRNAITLDLKSPEEKGGWGCFVCDLPPNGAVSVACDECMEKYIDGKVDLKFACLGYPGENRRIEIEKLTEVFQHDMSKHPEESVFITSEIEQDFIKCQNCGYIANTTEGVCPNCGETICYVCGCTDSAACPGGCWWARENICSQCDAETADEF